MHLLLTLCFVTAAYCQSSAGNCPKYFTDDNQEIPIGCVDPIKKQPEPRKSPWTPARINTHFVVFQRGNPNPVKVLRWNASLNGNDGLISSGSPVKFVIHGFLESARNSTMVNLKNAILEREPNAKVILVDWGQGAFSTDTNAAQYQQAANNALMVARVVASFVKRIKAAYRIPATSLHIIGHSLGGQIMGLATSRLNKDFTIKIASGMASDAASPIFTFNNITVDRKNVNFMLAVHTSSKLTPDTTKDDSLGVARAFADVDLYPNTGRAKQPACRNVKGDPRSIAVSFCSHIRGYIYLTEIIKQCRGSCGFEGTYCRNDQEALDGKCEGQTVNVCNFIKGPAQGSSRRQTVLTFETNLDKLNVECDSGQAQNNY